MFPGTGRGGLTVPRTRGALFFGCPDSCIPDLLSLSFSKRQNGAQARMQLQWQSGASNDTSYCT